MSAPVRASPVQIALLKAWGLAYGLTLPLVGILMGLMIVLVACYFRDFKDDRKSIKVSVIAVTAITTMNFVMNFAALTLKLILPFSEPDLLVAFQVQFSTTATWVLNALVAPISAVVQAICQYFFAKSAYAASPVDARPFVAYGLGGGILCTVLGGVGRGIVAVAEGVTHNGTKFRLAYDTFSRIWLGASVITDVAIAGILVHQLRKWRSGLHGTDGMLHKAASLVLSTFSLSASLMFCYLAIDTVVSTSGGIFAHPNLSGVTTALQILASPIYTISFLYALNRRKEMRKINRRSGIQLTPVTNSSGSRGFDRPQTVQLVTSIKADVSHADITSSDLVDWRSEQEKPGRAV